MANGDTITAQVPSSASGTTAVNAVETIVGLSDTYTVTTTAGATNSTWSKTDKTSNVTLSNGNLTATAVQTTSLWPEVRGSIGDTTGKHFFSVANAANPNGTWQVGIARSTVTLGSSNFGQTGTSIEIDGAGTVWNGSSALAGFGNLPTSSV